MSYPWEARREVDAGLALRLIRGQLLATEAHALPRLAPRLPLAIPVLE